MSKKILIILFLPLFTFAQAVTIDKVIGKVDNYIILKSEVESIFARQESQGQPISKCQAMQTMLINKMLVAKSELDSVTVEDKTINDQLNQRMSAMAQQFGSEKNIVEAYGKPLEQLKSELKGQVREQLLAQKMQETIQNGVKMTPNEVRKFFNGIPKDSLPVIPAEVELAQIVKYAVLKKSVKDELKQRLLGYKERILKGEDFGALATEFSEDPGSKSNGGLYVNTKRGQFDPKYEAAVFKIKPGQMTEIVESEFGFHLIRLESMKGQEYTSRHILLRPEYNRLDNSEATKILDSLHVLLQSDTIRFENLAKTYSDDANSKDVGGTIISYADQSAENKMAMDASMESGLYFLLQGLKVGEVSKPTEYRSEDGKTGMRIVKFIKEYNPHTANLNDDYQKIYKIALENKKNTVMDSWFTKAVKDVFIKVDPEYQGCQIFGLQNN